jgi:predicted nucleic acid-binding protein
VLLDTNVLVRHLTGEPTDQARRASVFLRDAQRLDVPPLIVAELVYVLESVYEQTPTQVAALVRSVLAYPPVEVSDEASLLRAVELYETRSVDFAEAYLAANAERTDGVVVSFDHDLDRIETVRRVEP